jgi:hypothetical protein
LRMGLRGASRREGASGGGSPRGCGSRVDAGMELHEPIGGLGAAVAGATARSSRSALTGQESSPSGPCKWRDQRGVRLPSSGAGSQRGSPIWAERRTALRQDRCPANAGTDPEVDLGPTSARRTTHRSKGDLSPERTLTNVASALSMSPWAPLRHAGLNRPSSHGPVTSCDESRNPLPDLPREASTSSGTNATKSVSRSAREGGSNVVSGLVDGQ